jgi:hypothetical protein
MNDSVRENRFFVPELAGGDAEANHAAIEKLISRAGYSTAGVSLCRPPDGESLIDQLVRLLTWLTSFPDEDFFHV